MLSMYVWEQGALERRTYLLFCTSRAFIVHVCCNAPAPSSTKCHADLLITVRALVKVVGVVCAQRDIVGGFKNVQSARVHRQGRGNHDSYNGHSYHS